MAPMEEDADIWDKNHQYSIITLTGEEIVDDNKEMYVLCALSWNRLINMMYGNFFIKCSDMPWGKNHKDKFIFLGLKTDDS